MKMVQLCKLQYNEHSKICTFMFSCTNRQLSIGCSPYGWTIFESCFSASASDTSISQYLECPSCATSFREIGSHNRYHLKRFDAEVDMLIALVSAQKRQSIRLLNIDYMVKDNTSYVFTIKDHIKQSRHGYMPPSIELKAFPHNPNSCIVSTLNKYINRAAA